MTTNTDTQAHGGGVEAAWTEWKRLWGESVPPTYVYEAFMHGYRAALAASPAAPAPAAGVDDWHPRIGDPVEASESFLSRYGEWARVPLWVVGISKDRGVDGLNVTVSDEWPVRYDGSGYTDGFYINRENGAPDDLRPRRGPAPDAKGER